MSHDPKSPSVSSVQAPVKNREASRGVGSGGSSAMGESPTPRTDRRIFKILSDLQSGTRDVVDAEGSRELEREIERWRDSNCRLRHEMEHQATIAQRRWQLLNEAVAVIQSQRAKLLDRGEAPVTGTAAVLDDIANELSLPNS